LGCAGVERRSGAVVGGLGGERRGEAFGRRSARACPFFRTEKGLLDRGT